MMLSDDEDDNARDKNQQHVLQQARRRRHNRCHKYTLYLMCHRGRNGVTLKTKHVSAFLNEEIPAERSRSRVQHGVVLRNNEHLLFPCASAKIAEGSIFRSNCKTRNFQLNHGFYY